MIRAQSTHLFGKLFDFILVSLFLPFSPLQTGTFISPAPCQRAAVSSPPAPPPHPTPTSLMSCGCTSPSGKKPQRMAWLSRTAAEAQHYVPREKKRAPSLAALLQLGFWQKAANLLFWTPCIGLLMIHNPAPDAAGRGPRLILVPSPEARMGRGLHSPRVSWRWLCTPVLVHLQTSLTTSTQLPATSCNLRLLREVGAKAVTLKSRSIPC